MLTWEIPQVPQRDLLSRLGRNWAIVCGQGVEVHTRKKYSRFWSLEKARAYAESLNRRPVPFGRDWYVIDVRDPRPLGAEVKMNGEPESVGELLRSFPTLTLLDVADLRDGIDEWYQLSDDEGYVYRIRWDSDTGGLLAVDA